MFARVPFAGFALIFRFKASHCRALELLVFRLQISASGPRQLVDTLKNIFRSPASKEADEGEVQEMGITHGILLRTYVPNRKVEAQKAQQDMYMEG